MKVTSRKEARPILVLSRHKNESVIVSVGEIKIRVTVVEIVGKKIKLGFTAPKDVPVHREEVYQAIHGAKPAASPPPRPNP